jgi:hypothetical protein
MLPAGHTGSSLFHAILAKAVARFPSVFAEARMPASPATFKRSYGEALARFEARRVASPERAEIARFMNGEMQAGLRFGDGDGSLPLTEYLAEKSPTPTLEQVSLTGKPGLPLELSLDGKLYRGQGLHDAVEQLFATFQLSEAARHALHWSITEAGSGALDLRGQRFVLLGAGAELAPTKLLLRAGADVLWIDLAAPFRSLRDVNDLSGTITRAPNASNLLEQPREIAAAIRAFASDGPVHVGLFAYAPGAGREWRLGAAMNAIVDSLEPELVRSLALLVSPTTTSTLAAEALTAAEQKHREAPAWQRMLQTVGAIRAPGRHRDGDTSVSLSTVALQGLSYQAAQYFCKIAAAESYGVFGIAGSGRPVTVSANVAGITRTRSLAHPLFELAFSGASKFGVRIFEPETTRTLSGLLMLHDLLNPAAPALSGALAPAQKATALLAQQVHGGIYTLPFVLDGVIRAAALVGLATEPMLLFGKGARAPLMQAAPAE